MLERTSSFQINTVQRVSALELLRLLPGTCSPLMIFDPQFRGVMNKLKFGNEGAPPEGARQVTGDDG